MSYELAIQHVHDGKNMLITGGAGVGKSFTLGKILEYVDNETQLNVARTAMTGMASLQFKMGETLHRCLGLGLASSVDDLGKIIKGFKFQSETIYEIQAIDILIIDEVSMLRSDTMELIDELLKYCKNNEKPFGGVQVILSGDFMQLPPIVKPEEKNNFKKRGHWAFESPVWKSLEMKVIYLKEIKRQDEPEFANALNMIRTGTSNDRLDQYFRKTKSHTFPEGVEPVRLLSTNKEVDMVNSNRLSEINEEMETYKARVNGVDEKLKKAMMRDCPGVENLRLKKGSQVMILINDKSKKYVNGSMAEYIKTGTMRTMYDDLVKYVEVKLISSGEIVRIPEYEWKKEKEKKGRTITLASFKQYPIKLGWAITIHKSQGMSLDYLQVDLKRCFADGMAYVALSRARSYKGLSVLGWSPAVIKANDDAFNFYMGLKSEGKI